MMTCIAVDDEPLALRLIKEHCGKIAMIDLKKVFLSALEAIDYLNQHEVDLAILDINMPEIDGMQLTTLIPKHTQIIFVTAYEEYALKSYDVEATDYILKPASFERFYKAIQKCLEKQSTNSSSSNVEKPIEFNQQTILLRGDKQVYQVPVKDIFYIEGLKDYAKVYISNKKKIVIRESLKNILSQLSGYGFMRVHRSFIVPLHKITSIEGQIIRIGDQQIPLNKTSKDEILAVFKKRGILGDRSNQS